VASLNFVHDLLGIRNALGYLEGRGFPAEARPGRANSINQ